MTAVTWQIGATIGAYFVGLSSATWVLSLKTRNAAVADIAWGLYFAGSALGLWALGGTARQLLVLALLGLWAARLSLHIAIRSWGEPEDPRYAAMRAHDPQRFWWKSLVRVFWLQAGIAAVIAQPIFFVGLVSREESLNLFDAAMMVLFAVGFVFEAGSDWQLSTFKHRAENRGKLLTRGFWALCRHPNYFGETLIWWSIYGLSLSLPWGWATITSPLAITWLLLKVSGVPLLEKAMRKSRPGYEEYFKTTPSFIPRFGWSRSRSKW